MKVVGLVGGIAYASTLDYYRLINEGVGKRLGGLHSAELALYSLNLHEYVEAANAATEENSDRFNAVVLSGAQAVKFAGAQFLALCSNTAHMAAPHIKSTLPDLPLLHIADCTADAIRQIGGVSRIGFVGTAYTMSKPFLQNRFKLHGFDVIVPEDPEEQAAMHKVILEELSFNVVNPLSKRVFLDAIRKLSDRGAQAVVLGCTEIPLLVQQADLPDVPLVDSTQAHVTAIVACIVGDKQPESYLP